MNTNSYRTVAFFAAALALLCWSMGPATAADGPKAATVTVAIDGTAFQPATLIVKAGDSVVWVNKDPFPHTATSPAGGFDSKEIGAGKSWQLKTTKAGVFPYTCLFHPTMKATLKVE